MSIPVITVSQSLGLVFKCLLWVLWHRRAYPYSIMNLTPMLRGALTVRFYFFITGISASLAAHSVRALHPLSLPVLCQRLLHDGRTLCLQHSFPAHEREGEVWLMQGDGTTRIHIWTCGVRSWNWMSWWLESLHAWTWSANLHLKKYSFCSVIGFLN